MKKDLVLPQLGEGIEKATVATWHVKVGDRVEHDSDVLEVVTDKASFIIPSDEKGIIVKLFAIEGEEVKVGQPLASIEVSNGNE